jgi:hypothetical protein
VPKSPINPAMALGSLARDASASRLASLASFFLPSRYARIAVEAVTTAAAATIQVVGAEPVDGALGRADARVLFGGDTWMVAAGDEADAASNGKTTMTAAAEQAATAARMTASNSELPAA